MPTRKHVRTRRAHYHTRTATARTLAARSARSGGFATAATFPSESADVADPVVLVTLDGVQWTRGALATYARHVLMDPRADPFTRASAAAFLKGAQGE